MAKPTNPKHKGATVISIDVRRFPLAAADERRRMSEDLERQMTGRPQRHGSWPDIDQDDPGQDPLQRNAGLAPDEARPEHISWRSTPATGYMPPRDGPFRCGHCAYFSGSIMGIGDRALGRCDQPMVEADPEVRGRVQAGGCCNFFTPTPTEPGALSAEAPTTPPARAA